MPRIATVRLISLQAHPGALCVGEGLLNNGENPVGPRRSPSLPVLAHNPRARATRGTLPRRARARARFRSLGIPLGRLKLLARVGRSIYFVINLTAALFEHAQYRRFEPELFIKTGERAVPTPMVPANFLCLLLRRITGRVIDSRCYCDNVSLNMRQTFQFLLFRAEVFASSLKFI